jgi:imidazole glycerol-phosphate synthase subunit HisF
MLKKRLVGVVTVKNGWAVQSFGYSRYLPLGKPECLVENLDRWGADEILVQVIDRSTANSRPDFELLENLGELGLETPLIYGGGIRSVADGVKLIQLGADRIVVDALLHEDLFSIRSLSERLGAQALIASLPLSWNGNSVTWFDYRSKTSKLITDEVLVLIQSGVISEVLISDWQHEGFPGGFEQKLVEEFPLKGASIIAFGGLSKPEQIKVLLQSSEVTAVAIGNFLSYREHAIQEYKAALTGTPLRLAKYESKFSMIADTDD